MKYDDLLTVPFKLNGRDKNGMDCYGLVIELTKRAGKPLIDLNCVHISEKDFVQKVGQVNLRQITEEQIRAGDIIQCTWNGEIHIGYLLDKKSVIHATTGGVRITPIFALINRKYFRVV